MKINIGSIKYSVRLVIVVLMGALLFFGVTALVLQDISGCKVVSCLWE